MASPYLERDVAEWSDITRDLIDAHPLTMDELLDAVQSAWNTVWQSRVGDGPTAVPLAEIHVPSIVKGYFFETLLARQLGVRFPGKWRGGQRKDEKDLVFEPDARYSIEVKSSGQMDTKVFGNRSHGQPSAEDSILSKPEKSGYYLTVNYYGRTLTLVRFGWIDHEDWKPQKAGTGQAATLSAEVYRHKLISIEGAYQGAAPVGLLKGIGAVAVLRLAEHGVNTVRELLDYAGSDKKVCSLRDRERARRK